MEAMTRQHRRLGAQGAAVAPHQGPSAACRRTPAQRPPSTTLAWTGSSWRCSTTSRRGCERARRATTLRRLGPRGTLRRLGPRGTGAWPVGPSQGTRSEARSPTTQCEGQAAPPWTSWPTRRARGGSRLGTQCASSRRRRRPARDEASWQSSPAEGLGEEGPTGASTTSTTAKEEAAGTPAQSSPLTAPFVAKQQQRQPRRGAAAASAAAASASTTRAGTAPTTMGSGGAWSGRRRVRTTISTRAPRSRGRTTPRRRSPRRQVRQCPTSSTRRQVARLRASISSSSPSPTSTKSPRTAVPAESTARGAGAEW